MARKSDRPKTGRRALRNELRLHELQVTGTRLSYAIAAWQKANNQASVRELARRAGVDTSQVTNWAKCQKLPESPTQGRILNVVGVTRDWVFNEGGPLPDVEPWQGRTGDPGESGKMQAVVVPDGPAREVPEFEEAVRELLNGGHSVPLPIYDYLRAKAATVAPRSKDAWMNQIRVVVAHAEERSVFP